MSVKSDIYLSMTVESRIVNYFLYAVSWVDGLNTGIKFVFVCVLMK